MSSELYWDNLGVYAPDKRRQAVVRTAYEIVNYLRNTERRLANKNYPFKYKIQEVEILPASPAELATLMDAQEIFVDAEAKRRLYPASILDRRKMLVKWGASPPESLFAVDAHGQVKMIAMRVSKAVLSELTPADVSEDEEDFALDLLFELSKYVYDSVAGPKPVAMEIQERHRNERTITLDVLPSSPRILVRYNTYVIRREYQALWSLALRPKQYQLPLLSLMQQTRYVRWEDTDPNRNLRYRVLTDEGKAGTGQQREFVRKALGTPDFAILEGPPGSGKTTTILELILQLVPQSKRVLFVASTHVAVDNAIEKLIETKVDGVSLAEKYGVIPLRIGSKDVISEKVLQYHIDNFVDYEHKRLLGFLGKIQRRTESQEMLYEALCDRDRGREIIENMAIESANLVCGTTIGILQSKFIKEADESKAVFDYLILDEASKTTFQEFLVPALHASRWVLSGDVRQLAPYVDQVPVRENLSRLPSLHDDVGKEDKAICTDIFHAVDSRGSSGFGRLIAYPEKSDLPRRYEEQAKAVSLIVSQNPNKYRGKTIDITNATRSPATLAEKLELLGSAIVLVPEDRIASMESVLPPHLGPGRLASDTLRRRRSSFASFLKRKGLYDPNAKSAWEDEVAWRLSRLYELRDLKERQDEYLRELRLLLPYFERADSPEIDSTAPANGFPQRLPRSEFVLREIRRIERIALPSVLELLQKGYKQHEEVDEEARIPLYDGFPPPVLEQRHTLLAFQHRMHPEISEFPRRHIYSDKALNDSPDLVESRKWTCGMYTKRVVWVNVIPRKEETAKRSLRTNFNLAERNVIVSHLKRFMAWSRQHPSEEAGGDGAWKIALLSFYKGQENKLSEAMRALFKSKGHRYFHSIQDRVSVEVCTVDRFQGHEADLVFLSLVNSGNKIGFLDNPNRLNVAITRAKYQLVIVGDRRTFRASKQSTDLLRSLERFVPEGPIEFGLE